MDTETVTSTVYGYCRVSTEGQEDGAGLDAQAIAIQTEADRRGWTSIDIRREVVSGGKRVDQRPVLAQILEQMTSGDVLVVAKGDRLARSLVVLAGLLEDSDRRGWSLVLLDLGMDTSTPAGRLVVQTLGAAAEYERRMIGARTREALAVKRSQGVRLGRPVIMDAETRAEVVRLRVDERWTFRQIAEEMTGRGIPTATGRSVWSQGTVQKVLQTADHERDHAERVAAIGAATA